MDNMEKTKLNNKGFSLVELLIALAVSGIVIIVIGTFVVSGTSFFRRHSDSITIQNELQEVSNKITDALMQATSIEISDADGYLVIRTGDFEAYDNGDSKIKPRIVVWDKANTSIYIIDHDVADPTKITDESEGYLLSKCVTSVTISLDETSQTTETDDVGNIYKVAVEPVIFNVAIELTKRGEVKADAKTTTLRNKLTSMVINGVSYKVD